MTTIMTDSTSDLGVEITTEFDIPVIPLSVTIDGVTYRDGMDIHQSDLFALVQKHGELPKTAAPSVGEFIEFFDRSGEIVFIGISSKLSATVQNAILAAGELPAGKVRSHRFKQLIIRCRIAGVARRWIKRSRSFRRGDRKRIEYVHS